jgi:antitoxin FitA
MISFDPVAQLIVRNLDERVKQRLRRRAARHRRSLEAEVRDILSAAVAGPETVERNLGSRIAGRFRTLGVDFEARELRGFAARAPRLSR